MGGVVAGCAYAEQRDKARRPTGTARWLGRDASQGWQASSRAPRCLLTRGGWPCTCNVDVEHHQLQSLGLLLATHVAIHVRYTRTCTCRWQYTQAGCTARIFLSTSSHRHTTTTTTNHGRLNDAQPPRRAPRSHRLLPPACRHPLLRRHLQAMQQSHIRAAGLAAPLRQDMALLESQPRTEREAARTARADQVAAVVQPEELDRPRSRCAVRSTASHPAVSLAAHGEDHEDGIRYQGPYAAPIQ